MKFWYKESLVQPSCLAHIKERLRVRIQSKGLSVFFFSFFFNFFWYIHICFSSSLLHCLLLHITINTYTAKYSNPRKKKKKKKTDQTSTTNPTPPNSVQKAPPNHLDLYRGYLVRWCLLSFSVFWFLLKHGLCCSFRLWFLVHYTRLRSNLWLLNTEIVGPGWP